MYRVLLPVDDEERARAQVDAVLELPSADESVTVDVVYVHEDRSGPDAEWAAGGFSEEYEAVMSEHAERSWVPDAVDAATEMLAAGGVEHAVYERAGEPAEEIIAAAEALDSDHVVLGVRKRSPVGKVLFGSVTQAVILDTDRPVTAVAPGDED